MMMRNAGYFQLWVVALTAVSAWGKDIRVGSSLGRKLLSQATPLSHNNNHRFLEDQGQYDYSFVADYSIKFQGCHHVSQWNADVDDEDDVRIRTKRLVRFRLCLSDSCNSDRAAGCTSKYGDYVVDMNTFVASYLEAAANEKEEICEETEYECNNQCGDDEECVEACYESYQVSYCLEDEEEEEQDGDFDPADYAECAQYDLGGRRKLEDGDAGYYLGPYCADQGGEIHLGLFTDDTCTTFAQNGESSFYSATGYELPYSDESLVSTRCMKCGKTDGNGNYEIKDVCTDVYPVSGKCETKMNVDYPNESACTYIEGIKIIRADGVIRTSAIRKSKAAAVCIGLFLTFSVLLAGYVYYLRTKLGRARINLAASNPGFTSLS